MPSARLRYAGEAVILVLAALGLALAGFDAIVIVVVMALALVLVAMLELVSSREAARLRAAREQPAKPPPHAGGIEREPGAVEETASEAGATPDPEPEPAPAVSERSARALLASTPPPLPPEQSKPAQVRPKTEPGPTKREKPARRPFAERRPKPPNAAPPPPPREPEPVARLPREWNLWELQRAVRDTAEGSRQEEWGALLIHLREFANADGELPVEFDALVRESFGDVLAVPPEPAAVS